MKEKWNVDMGDWPLRKDYETAKGCPSSIVKLAG